MILSVKKAMDILDCVSEKGSISIKELSEQMDMPKSTVCRLAQTMEACGYLYQEPIGGDYLLSYKFLRVGDDVLEKFGIRECVMPVLKKLADMTSETVNLTVLDEGQALYIVKIEAPRIQTGIKVGGRAPLNCTASGKVMLASLSPNRVDSILKHSAQLEALTENSIISQDALLSELEECRRVGYSLCRDELANGVYAIGVAIQGYPGREAAAISIAGNSNRFSNERLEEFKGYIIEASREISRQFSIYKQKNK